MDAEPSLEVRGHCAFLCLGRNSENRFTTLYLNRLMTLLDSVLTDEKFSKCTALITYSTGRFYSNGINLTWVGSRETEEEVEEFVRALCRFYYRILTFPMLTVAAVNGHAFAGGALLALAHDAKLMQQRAGWLCLPEVFLKMRFRPSLLALLKCKVPNAAVRDFVLLGHRLTGEKAAEVQLVDKVVPKEADILSEAETLTRKLLFMDNPRLLSGEYSRDFVRVLKEDVYQEAATALRDDRGSQTNPFATSKL